MRPILEKIVNDINIRDLPDSWTCFDFRSFSSNKTLYDYQVEALENAVKALYKFYKTSNKTNMAGLKKTMVNCYIEYGLEPSNYDVKNLKSNTQIYSILKEYFKVEEDAISFYNFINRMSFWMATGSGKTLLIIKMFAIISELMKNGEIPKGDIMFLAPGNDLIDQLKSELKEFNKLGELFINLISLKDYNKEKAENKLKLKSQIDVFYYRSDNISNETKEILLNYKEIDNGGNWYILLDEAHKGSKEDSVRQAYYSILSRNGFLFNFSATFTEEQDIATTVKNFNLKEFITSGYGKNIYTSKSEFDSFKEKDASDDFTIAAKQKIVLKSLITLTYIKKCVEEVRNKKDLRYHNPLLMTLGDSVNVENADLKMFFKELINFSGNKIPDNIFEEAKDELISELLNNDKYAIGDEKLKIKADILRNINKEDVLSYVYNSKGYGAIEVIESGNSKELAFRMKSSDKTSLPFALIKIGDISGWKKELGSAGYEFIKSFEGKDYFKKLNESPDINILMGSRAFYEGWDSTRPNVINYINIGGEDAKKFVLQSIGRGIRIEPIKNNRKRLGKIIPSLLLPEEREEILGYVNPIETLFVFATNRSAIQNILDITKDKSVVGDVDTRLVELDCDNHGRDLFIPVYKEKRYELCELPKFPLAKGTFNRMKWYLENTTESVILLNYPILSLKDLNSLKELVLEEAPEQHFVFNDSREYKDLDVLIFSLKQHIRSKAKVLEKFKELADEIIHFKKITINEEKYEEIKEKINKVKNSSKLAMDKDIILKDLTMKLQEKKISIEEYQRKYEELSNIKSSEVYNGELVMKYIPEHYYIPVLYSEREKIEYINHIITVQSEVKFLKDLEKFISEKDANLKNEFDWWMFSKIDQTTDEIYIPYLDTKALKLFFPDFIFWMCKDNSYKIVFVDPKSPSYTDAQTKIDGFVNIFGDKVFHKKEYDIEVELLMYTEDKSSVNGKRYESYWTDKVSDIFFGSKAK